MFFVDFSDRSKCAKKQVFCFSYFTPLSLQNFLFGNNDVFVKGNFELYYNIHTYYMLIFNAMQNHAEQLTK